MLKGDGCPHTQWSWGAGGVIHRHCRMDTVCLPPKYTGQQPFSMPSASTLSPLLSPGPNHQHLSPETLQQPMKDLLSPILPPPKVSPPHISRNKLFKGKINFYNRKCKKCSYHVSFENSPHSSPILVVFVCLFVFLILIMAVTAPQYQAFPLPLCPTQWSPSHTRCSVCSGHTSLHSFPQICEAGFQVRVFDFAGRSVQNTLLLSLYVTGLTSSFFFSLFLSYLQQLSWF